MAFNWVDGAIKRSQHKGNQLLLLIILAESAGRDSGECWPSVETLAEACRMSKRSVQECLRALERSGEITTDRQASPAGTNLYRLNPVLLGGAESAPPQIPVAGGADSRIQGVRQASPKPVIEPVNEPDPPAREANGPPVDPWDQPDHIDLIRARRETFDAYWAATGLESKYARSKAHTAAEYELCQAQRLGELPSPGTMRLMTAYVIADRRSGNIPSIPTLEQVLDRQGEYLLWLAAWTMAGEPRDESGQPDYLLLRKQQMRRGRHANAPVIAPVPVEAILANIWEAAEERTAFPDEPNDPVEVLAAMRDRGEITPDQYVVVRNRFSQERTNASGQD